MHIPQFPNSSEPTQVRCMLPRLRACTKSRDHGNVLSTPLEHAKQRSLSFLVSIRENAPLCPLRQQLPARSQSLVSGLTSQGV